MRSAHSALLVSILCISVGLDVGCASSGVFDPAIADPPGFDPEDPPRLAETVLLIEGEPVYAIVYEAQGRGPHPTVVLLHGFPGNERNLDLAQAMRRAGWNVVFFHYRGSWGSGGAFSFTGVLDDVAGVVAAIREPERARAHRIDPGRIALVGHSMGGFAALVSASEIEAVDCVASIAGANLGGLLAGAAASPETSRAMATRLDGWSGPIRGASGEALVAEVAAQRERFDTLGHARSLAGKPVLLVAGALDRVTPAALHHEPLVAALEGASSRSLRSTILPRSDHAFSAQRIELAERITRWLAEDCRTPDPQTTGR